jgi:hypothetical protein
LIAISIFNSADTFAIWSSSFSDTTEVDANIDKRNDSLKYIIFMPLKDGKHLEHEITNDTDFDSFVAVGYTGLLDYIEFPDEYTLAINDEVITKPVTAILSLSDDQYSTIPLYLDNKLYVDKTIAAFKSNLFIKKLIISSSVNEIGAAVFAGCISLNTIIFNPSQTPLEIGVKAFNNCNNITSIVYNDRVINSQYSDLP